MFIKDYFCISPQHTTDAKHFCENVIHYTGNKLASVEPDYTKHIPKGLLRRMGKAVRMGVGAGLTVLSKNEKPDGIIIGTANGGLEDCIKFLNQIVQYEEGTLTPTNFVQSTPNSIAGHLSLLSGNSGYNATHIHSGLAFENALLDAKMLFETNEANTLLVGNVEEISEYNYNIDLLAGIYKEELITSDRLLSSGTKGTICGEGAAMYYLSTDNTGAKAEIVDFQQICFPDDAEIENCISSLLEKNNLTTKDITSLVVGYNGDVSGDANYNSIVDSFFSEANIYSFKNLVGEYATASAFGLWLSIQILQGEPLPAEVFFKKQHTETGTHVLLLNHFKKEQFSFVLLRK